MFFTVHDRRTKFFFFNRIPDFFSLIFFLILLSSSTTTKELSTQKSILDSLWRDKGQDAKTLGSAMVQRDLFLVLVLVLSCFMFLVPDVFVLSFFLPLSSFLSLSLFLLFSSFLLYGIRVRMMVRFIFLVVPSVCFLF